MDRLAIDIGNAAAIEGETRLRLSVTPALAEVFALHAGQRILCFRESSGEAVASASIASLARADSTGSMLTLEGVRWFAASVPLPQAFGVTPGYRVLSGQDFDDLVTRGEAADGFEETFAGLIGADDVADRPLDALHRLVLIRSEGLCELTGASQAPRSTRLATVSQPIRTRDAGGSADMHNMLALSAEAAAAFYRFELTIGPDFEIIADLSRLDPELVERFNPLNRLIVPARYQKGVLNELAWHREQFFSIKR